MKVNNGVSIGVRETGVAEHAAALPAEVAAEASAGPVADAGLRRGPSAQAQGRRAEMDAQGAMQKHLDKLLKITKEAQGFEVHSFLGDSPQMQTSMDQASRSLNDAHRLLVEARRAGAEGDFETAQEKVALGYQKLQIGLRAQGQAADALSGVEDTRANWAKFVRDAAVETDIALLGLMTGGAGTLAGRARGLQQLALSQPKIYAAVAAVVDSTVISLPHLLPKMQDYMLKGESPAWALAQAFQDVGTEGICGAVFGKVLQVAGGKVAQGAAGAAAFVKQVYAHPEMKKLMGMLEEHLPADKLVKFKASFEAKVKAFYEKAKGMPDAVAERMPERAKALANKGWHLVEDKSGRFPGMKLIRFETKMDSHWIEHVKQHSDEIGRLTKRPAHDLIGKANKFEKEIMQALGSKENIHNTGEVLKGQLAVSPMLGEFGQMAMKERGGRTVGSWIEEKGISGMPKDVLLALDARLAAIGTGPEVAKRAGFRPWEFQTEDVDKAGKAIYKSVTAEEVVPTLRGGIRVELARAAHADAALHHQVFSKMSGSKAIDAEEFLAAIKPGDFRFERAGQTKVTVGDMEEAAFDVVHAWRDTAREYKKGMSWQEIIQKIETKDRPFSPLAKSFLYRAMDKLEKAEGAGIVGTNPDKGSQVYFQMRALWVYTGGRAGDALQRSLDEYRR